MKLTEKLVSQKENFRKNAPKEVQKSMMSAHEDLVAKNIGESSLKVSDFFPKFNLLNQSEKNVSLSRILESGNYHIITFYRGGWCPYCNLELKALQDNIDKFKELKTTLTAITPETPDNSLTTTKKNDLKFEILTDKNCAIAQDAGIAFKLPEILEPIYREFGIDIQKHNGDKKNILPIPATFILDNKGKILFEYVQLDYTKRLDPEMIINFLEKQSSEEKI